MNYRNSIFIFFLFISIQAGAQSINATFPQLANQQVNLEGFYGFQTYGIDSTQINEDGKFVLEYSPGDYGMGYLGLKNKKPFIVVLSGKAIELKGEAFSSPETVEILKGKENRLFGKYASEHPRREQVLSAWTYLGKIYSRDSLFVTHENPLNAIEQEKRRIKKEDSAFLAGLEPHTYVSWYLPVRKLVNSVSTIAQYRTEEIPDAIAAFRKMDYTDPRLYKSGLIKDVIESHFWLIENSGRSLDSVYIEMKISIDSMTENLASDEKKLNEITDYLFKLLEKRSLFPASEYLALKLLNEKSCTINNELAARLESHRAMKKGNTAPDFTFKEDCLAPGYASGNAPNKLSNIDSKYTVVVFGAGWCPQCHEELSNLARLYEKWKKHSVEVVFVSLDENIAAFKNFAGDFPFISTCDYKKWESPKVKDYHVFATPTMYLLDNERKILLRPNSVNHLDSWVDWFLVKGNK